MCSTWTVHVITAATVSHPCVPQWIVNAAVSIVTDKSNTEMCVDIARLATKYDVDHRHKIPPNQASCVTDMTAQHTNA